jgi:hypothetical protein
MASEGTDPAPLAHPLHHLAQPLATLAPCNCGQLLGRGVTLGPTVAPGPWTPLLRRA